MQGKADSLVAELAEIRKTWEGFDDDIARPLAQIVRRIRTQYEAKQRRQGEEFDRLHNEIARLEDEITDGVSAPEHEEMMEQLRDVNRGVRTLEEVMREWGPSSGC